MSSLEELLVKQVLVVAKDNVKSIVDNGITQEMIKKITEGVKPEVERIALENSKPKTRKINVVGVPDFKIPADQFRHKNFEAVLQATSCGPVTMVGPAGAGKTNMAEQVAEVLGVPFYFTGAVQSEYKLMGFLNAQGQVVRTAFREAYEKGGLFLFDEIDASSPAAVLAFNAALANGQCDFPDGMVKRHKDFYVMAASNTWWTGATREYVGRNQLDAASLDRFIFITIDYDEELEKNIASDTSWTAYVQAARKAVRESGVKLIVSPRASILGSKLLDIGVKFNDVKAQVLWKGLEPDTIRKVEQRITVKYTPKKKLDKLTGEEIVEAVEETAEQPKTGTDGLPF